MDGLHRFEIEDVLRRIDLATDGTRETLLVRLKRWILFRSIIADLAAQAAVVAVSRNLDGSGGVYALDIPTPSCRRPPLVTLRQFRGKGFLRLASGFATDDVYAVDKLDRLHLLRNLDSGGGAGGKGGGGGGGMLEVIGGGGWLLAPRWIAWLRSDPVFSASVGSHAGYATARGGEVFSWGRNPHGELGTSVKFTMDYTVNPAILPALLDESEGMSCTSAGAYHAAAVSKSGKVYTWGCNANNELGVDNIAGQVRTGHARARRAIG